MAPQNGRPPGPRPPVLVRSRGARTIKRTMDAAFSLVLGALAIPIVVVAAVIVKLTSAGPAFHSQIRVTRGGRTFRLWKLRTMVQDAEREGVPVWPEENDPRITRTGRILRLLWIDELPQLWNVLKGDMSVVGPRPERPEFVEAFAAAMPKYRDRHAVAAGMTGLAQVTGLTGNTSIRRRLALDLRYIRRWTPALDLWILTRTAGQALRRAIGGRNRNDPGDANRSSGGGGSLLELRSGARRLSERDQ